MRKDRKQIVIIIVALAALIGAAVSIYLTQFAGPSATTALHEGIGTAMAEETSKLLNHNGRIVIITINEKFAPELKTQIDAFKKALSKAGNVKIEKTRELDPEGQKKYRAGGGLSGRRYVRTVKKDTSADAFVSFIGAPDLTDAEVTELGKRPKLVAEVRVPEKLKPVFDKKLIDVAIVSRFEFPAPGKGGKSPRDLFDSRFQIVTPANAASLP